MSPPTCGACRVGSSSATTHGSASVGTGCTRGAPPRVAYVTGALADSPGPVVAVTDFVKSVTEGIARFVPQPFVPLGTDGFGFSDTRAALRRHFEVDAAHVVVAVLSGLSTGGSLPSSAVEAAITRYGLAADAPDPLRT